MTIIDSAQSSSNFRFPADSEIRRIISERIENHKQGVGIVVGIVGTEGRRVVAHGHLGTDDLRPWMPIRFLKSAPSPKFSRHYYSPI